MVRPRPPTRPAVQTPGTRPSTPRRSPPPPHTAAPSTGTSSVTRSAAPASTPRPLLFRSPYRTRATSTRADAHLSSPPVHYPLYSPHYKPLVTPCPPTATF